MISLACGSSVMQRRALSPTTIVVTSSGTQSDTITCRVSSGGTLVCALLQFFCRDAYGNLFVYAVIGFGMDPDQGVEPKEKHVERII